MCNDGIYNPSQLIMPQMCLVYTLNHIVQYITLKLKRTL